VTHPFSYEDRRVVVTGAARGVGAALLEVLAELQVAHVTVLDLEAPSGPHDVFVAADLSDEGSVREWPRSRPSSEASTLRSRRPAATSDIRACRRARPCR
jgi:NAD(P)-dependent dehydrogenase (short-subunit alcohol dehydrogenase family)